MNIRYYILSAAVFALMLLSGGASAQKAVKDNNDQLKALQARVDSLQALVDSLRRFRTEESEAISVIMEDRSRPDMPLEDSDSLYAQWCRNLMTADAEVPENLDSARFTSRVSDEVLMERLKAMNPFFTLPFNNTVKNYMILYSEKRSKSMARMLGLSSYIMPTIEETFNRYGLPLELKYMAVIESQLNPLAVSRVGAKGMWQFMYKTARIYNLEITSFVDERLDVVKSCDAAARYLRDAYRVFGDWSLAISSYNCGMGNVQKAIRRAGSRNFWDIYPYLPSETRGYMPAFVGAYYAFTYYKDYGLVPADMGMPPQTDTFHINRNLHFKQISEVVGVPETDIRALNPQYVHEIIPGSQHPYVLTLPYNWSSAFIDAIPDSLYSHRASELLSDKIMKGEDNISPKGGVNHKVKSGETLSKIASRYGVKVDQIRKWNGLKSDVLRVGQVLYIGSYAPGKTPVKGSSTDSYSVYIVKKGDTLSSIASKYPRMTAKRLMEYNKISSNIVVGQKIKIPKN
ncbi:MAG: LysM peptidoglycan-binding domain-containing protein [Bacteroidales bacterium]|nr:LysM peptidoglycan-binding domain-containing protein [Bacteroidales bacterium]